MEAITAAGGADVLPAAAVEEAVVAADRAAMHAGADVGVDVAAVVVAAEALVVPVAPTVVAPLVCLNRQCPSNCS